MGGGEIIARVLRVPGHCIFSKYLRMRTQNEGIDIWGFTPVEIEPHGNGNNWESMHFSPAEMTTDFVQHHLGPNLELNG